MKTKIYRVEIWQADGIKSPYVGIWRYDNREKYNRNIHYSDGKITPSSEKRLLTALKGIVPDISMGNDYLSVQYPIRP